MANLRNDLVTIQTPIKIYGDFRFENSDPNYEIAHFIVSLDDSNKIIIQCTLECVTHFFVPSDRSRISRII